MRIALICRGRQVKTLNRTGIDANPAGHAGHFIELRFIPERSLYRGTENAEGVIYCFCRTDTPAGAAFNAPISRNDVKGILISRYCISRAKPLACATAIALIRNPICHLSHHGDLIRQHLLPVVSRSEDPTRTAYSNRLSICPCPPFFPGLLLSSVPVSRLPCRPAETTLDLCHV